MLRVFGHRPIRASLCGAITNEWLFRNVRSSGSPGTWQPQVLQSPLERTVPELCSWVLVTSIGGRLAGSLSPPRKYEVSVEAGSGFSKRVPKTGRHPGRPQMETADGNRWPCHQSPVRLAGDGVRSQLHSDRSNLSRGRFGLGGTSHKPWKWEPHVSVEDP